MDDKKIEVLRIEISRLDVRPGEMLLVRVPDVCLENASRCLEKLAPDGVRVLVAPYSAEFSVVSSSD